MQSLRVILSLFFATFAVWAQEEVPVDMPDSDTYAMPDPASPATPAEQNSEEKPAPKSKKAKKPAKVAVENDEAEAEPKVEKLAPVKAAEAPAKPAEVAPPPPGVRIADGQPVVVQDKGMTFTPPVGWEVATERSGLSLETLGPLVPGVYRRNIQVRAFTPGHALSSSFAEEIAKKITESFSAVPGITDYRMRDHVGIDLADGRKALLFYSDLKLGDAVLMQAHVVTSSEKRHFIVTFTDLAQNIDQKDGQNASPQWTEAWAAMVSLKLDSPIPEESDLLPKLAIGGGVFVGLFALFALIRRMRASQLYDSFDGDSVDVDSDGGDSIHAKTAVATKIKSEYDTSDDDDIDDYKFK